LHTRNAYKRTVTRVKMLFKSAAVQMGAPGGDAAAANLMCPSAVT